jgi:hypothetical protein
MGQHVAWRESRQGEPFFVEAERTADGWIFDEQSSFEPRCYRVAARPGWVDKANDLLASAARYGAEPRQKDLDPRDGWRAGYDVAVGDFHDNAAVLAVAQWKIATGAVVDAVLMLDVLRRHIAATHESKSERILLPAIDEAVRSARRAEAERRPTEAATPLGGPVEDRPKTDTSAPSPTVRHQNHVSDGRVRAFKSQIVDAAMIVTALSWTHGLLVHDLATMPGLEISPTGANVLAGSVLALALRFVSRSG